VEALTQRMIDQQWIIAGNLDTVLEQVADLKTCFGDGELEYFAWNMSSQGAISQEEALKQIEIVGTKVLPRFA
jgi:hypothetical protein